MGLIRVNCRGTLSNLLRCARAESYGPLHVFPELLDNL